MTATSKSSSPRCNRGLGRGRVGASVATNGSRPASSLAPTGGIDRVEYPRGIVGWVAATPFTIRHPRAVQRAGQAIIGPLEHLFEHVDPKPGEYTEKDVSPYFWHNGQYSDSDEYKALFDGHIADWRLRINGLVERPVELDLLQLRATHKEHITQHFCIQRWSGVAKWGGVSMQTIMDLVKPDPEAKWVVFYSLGDGADKGVYYDAHPIEHRAITSP